MTVAKVRLAIAAMGKPKTKVADLCRELGVTRKTLYRHVSPPTSFAFLSSLQPRNTVWR